MRHNVRENGEAMGTWIVPKVVAGCLSHDSREAKNIARVLHHRHNLSEEKSEFFYVVGLATTL